MNLSMEACLILWHDMKETSSNDTILQSPKRTKTDETDEPVFSSSGSAGETKKSKWRQPEPTMNAQEHNQVLAEIFTLLSKAEKAKGDMHRANSYAKGSVTIANHTEKILSGTEAKKLPGIGKAIGEKIDEFLQSGTVSKLDKLMADPEVSAMRELQRISGVGPQQAKDWIKRGIMNIEDVASIESELTNHQKIGLRHQAPHFYASRH